MGLSEDQLRLLTSMAIGDGSCTPRSPDENSRDFRTPILRFEHSKAQKEYVIAKASLIKKVWETDNKPKETKRGNWEFKVSSEQFFDIYWLLYERTGPASHRKKISWELLDLLTLQELAIWWMDDGGPQWDKRCWTGVLSICEFSFREADWIIEWIFEQTGATGRMNKRWDKKYKKYYPVVVFNSKELGVFIEKIKPYKLDGMDYKFDLSRRESLPRGPRIGRHRSNVFTEQEKVGIISELVARELTQKQIAEKHHCSVSLLEKVMSREKWPEAWDLFELRQSA